jgi:hypothetical protein
MLLILEIPRSPPRCDADDATLPRIASVLANLPALGDVLCEVRPAPALPEHALARWRAVVGNALPLPDHPWLHGIARVAALRAAVDIDSDGPRECLEFLDMRGAALMRVWLLPDSDYCAWDYLLARHAVPVASASIGASHHEGWMGRHHWRIGLRRWQAAVVRFRLERVAGLNLLGMSPVPASALARQCAKRLAGEA